MSQIENSKSDGYTEVYKNGSRAPATYTSLSAHNSITALKKNSIFREIEKDVIKRYRSGKWKSARNAGSSIYSKMKEEYDESAKKNKRPGKEAAPFPLTESNGAIQVAVYIGKYLKKKKVSEDLAKLGIPSKWNPDENEFVPYFNT